VDATARFADLVARPDADVPLAEAAFVIAAHASPGLDVESQLHRLDDLADGCAAQTLDALLEHLFGDLGFQGDRVEYYDPANSYLDRVLDRRRGLPITLSIVLIEVGRRIGVPLAAVGMPGHFLVRDGVDPRVFVDPFHGGAVLDEDGCEQLFRTLHGERLDWNPAFLAPVGHRVILQRMLANLRGIFAARRDRASLLWTQRLRAAFPGVDADEQRELAAALAANGRLPEAADVLDALASEPGGTVDDVVVAERLRARLN
jgi:regulator of sirC expression with transglutaminase-like and TPR domain